MRRIIRTRVCTFLRRISFDEPPQIQSSGPPLLNDPLRRWFPSIIEQWFFHFLGDLNDWEIILDRGPSWTIGNLIVNLISYIITKQFFCFSFIYHFIHFSRIQFANQIYREKSLNDMLKIFSLNIYIYVYRRRKYVPCIHIYAYRYIRVYVIFRYHQCQRDTESHRVCHHFVA